MPGTAGCTSQSTAFPWTDADTASLMGRELPVAILPRVKPPCRAASRRHRGRERRRPGIVAIEPVRIGRVAHPGILARSGLHPRGARLAGRLVGIEDLREARARELRETA